METGDNQEKTVLAPKYGVDNIVDKSQEVVDKL